MFSFFTGIWPLIQSYGTFGIIAAGGLAFYFLSPIKKEIGLWVILGVFLGIACHYKGVSDGEHRVQTKWDQAEKRMEQKGKDARSRAVTDVARKRVRSNQRDIYDRSRR